MTGSVNTKYCFKEDRGSDRNSEIQLMDRSVIDWLNTRIYLPRAKMQINHHLRCMLTVREGKHRLYSMSPRLTNVFGLFTLHYNSWMMVKRSKWVNEIFDFTKLKKTALIPPTTTCWKSYIVVSLQINHGMCCASPLCIMGAVTSQMGKVWNNNQGEITQCHETSAANINGNILTSLLSRGV